MLATAESTAEKEKKLFKNYPMKKLSLLFVMCFCISSSVNLFAQAKGNGTNPDANKRPGQNNDPKNKNYGDMQKANGKMQDKQQNSTIPGDANTNHKNAGDETKGSGRSNSNTGNKPKNK